MLKHRYAMNTPRNAEIPSVESIETNDNQDCSVRILLLGNRQVGKTRFLHEYIEDRNRESSCVTLGVGGGVSNRFPTTKANNQVSAVDANSSFDSDISRRSNDYIPTSLEVYKAKFMVNNTQYLLVITDVTGNHEDKSYVFLRNSFYNIQAKVDVILLCFSMVDLISFADLKTKWMPEIKKYFKDVPIILVGTKDDLKQSIKSEKRQQKSSIKSPLTNRRRITLPTIPPAAKPSMSKQTSNASSATTQTTTESTSSTIVPCTPPGIITPTLSPLLTPPSPSQLGHELILAGQSILAYSPSSSSPVTTTTNNAAFFNPPPTPCSPPYRTARVSQSVSMISRVSKDELVSTLVAASTVTSSERNSAATNQLNNEDDDNDEVFEEAHRTKDATGSGVETFRKLLEEIDKAPKQLESTQSQPNDLNTGFLNETGVSSSNFNSTMGSSVVEQSDVGLPSNLVGGGGCDEKSSKETRKYIHTRQLGKMRDEIGAVECFKTRADDPKSINTLMERTLAVGLNSHLKRRKAELKKQTSYEPKSIEDLSPFGDHGSKVSRRLKTLEISAQKVVETEELDVRVVGLAGLDEDDDDCVRAVPVLSGVCDSNNSKAEEEGEDRIKMIDESLERSGNVGGAACEDVGKKSTATEDKGCQRNR